MNKLNELYELAFYLKNKEKEYQNLTFCTTNKDERNNYTLIKEKYIYFQDVLEEYISKRRKFLINWGLVDIDLKMKKELNELTSKLPDLIKMQTRIRNLECGLKDARKYLDEFFAKNNKKDELLEIIDEALEGE